MVTVSDARKGLSLTPRRVCITLCYEEHLAAHGHSERFFAVFSSLTD